MNSNDLGTLYIVATPLGNLQDITLRAIETLKKVNYIAAEDTRHSGALLQNYEISTPTFSLHEHNERERTAKILADLQNGQTIALISDAGTPLISDPGYFLVQEARKLGIRVVPIPGACAAIAALSAAGLPTDRFVFEGFLPAKTKARSDRLQELVSETRTLIFYEAPHRILSFLKDVEKIFGKERRAVLARELTKMYETIFSGTIAEIITFVSNDSNQQRGEIVFLIEGAPEKLSDMDSRKILELLLETLPVKQAAEIAAKLTGQRKNELYDLALQLKQK